MWNARNKERLVRFEVFMALTMNNAVLLADCFHSDVGGDTFLRNVGFDKRHTASHSRGCHSSNKDKLKEEIKGKMHQRNEEKYKEEGRNDRMLDGKEKGVNSEGNE
jgi:hypothetical protein